MAATVAITNLTSRPVYVPLHSGENLRLQPGRTAGSVDEVEVKGNARFEKLLGLRILSSEPSHEGTEEVGDVSKTAVEETAEGHGAQEMQAVDTVHTAGTAHDVELTGDADSPVEPRRA